MSVIGKKRAKTITCKSSILYVNFTHLDLSINKSATTDILQQFRKTGHRTSLITARSNSYPKLGKYKGSIILVPLRRIPLVLPAMYTMLMFFFFPIYILVYKPDFVLIEPGVHILSSIPCVVVSKLLKRKIILDIRTIPVETAGLRGYLDKLWFFVSVSVAKEMFDGVTIITSLMKNEICENFGINPLKVGVWESGVSENLFNPENIDSKVTKLRINLGLIGKFVVFYHGVFTPSRGLYETIEAMALLRQEYPEVVLFLLGDGPDVGRLKSLIQEKGLQESIIIHRKVEQSEVPAFIGISDVGIVPLPYNKYWRFQSPLKLLEYLSMKKVVLLSDIPAHRIVVNKEKCAIFIPSIDAREIAKSIVYALSNRERLLVWGEVGREIVLREYTWGKIAKKLENYLVYINN